MDYTKPLPLVTDLNRPHWEGARRREFLVQQCTACEHRWFPPLPNCNRCLSTDYRWTPVKGTGKVYSFIVYHQAWLEGFKQELPYNVALIELDEGLRIVNNVGGVGSDELRIGMPVRVAYDEVSPEVVIPRFVPADT